MSAVISLSEWSSFFSALWATSSFHSILVSSLRRSTIKISIWWALTARICFWSSAARGHALDAVLTHSTLWVRESVEGSVLTFSIQLLTRMSRFSTSAGLVTYCQEWTLTFKWFRIVCLHRLACSFVHSFLSFAPWSSSWSSPHRWLA